MPKLKVNDISLYYECHGKGGPWIVFLSGFCADHLSWLNLLGEYAKHHQILLLDNRGCGQSDSPDMPYTISLFAKDTIALCDELNIEQAHFIGNSMGGAIAQQIAYQYSHRVKSIILSNSFCKISSTFALHAKAYEKLMRLNLPQNVLAEISLPWIFSSTYLNEENRIEDLIQLISLQPFPMTKVGYHNQLHALLNFDSTDWIQRIRSPCFFLSGEDDIISFPHNIEKISKQLDQTRYFCIPKAGHLPHLENRALFIQAVNAFLETL